MRTPDNPTNDATLFHNLTVLCFDLHPLSHSLHTPSTPAVGSKHHYKKDHDYHNKKVYFVHKPYYKYKIYHKKYYYYVDYCFKKDFVCFDEHDSEVRGLVDCGQG